jgi:hypothetical protein
MGGKQRAGALSRPSSPTVSHGVAAGADVSAARQTGVFAPTGCTLPTSPNTGMVDVTHSAEHVQDKNLFVEISSELHEQCLSAPGKGARTLDDVVAFGGIVDYRQMGVRSSDRLRSQPFADATQMERAMWLAQRRDVPSYQGTATTRPHSILNFSAIDISSRASSMGVSLGESEACRAASIKLIKDTEFQRSLTILKKVESVVDTDTLAPHKLVVSDISTLCDDLNVEDVGEETTGAAEILVPKPIRGRNKKLVDNSAVRRSKRIQIQNSKISKDARR